MNYMSNCNDCHDYPDHDKKHDIKDKCETIIKCGPISTPVTLPIGTEVGTSFPIANLSIDSTGLCNPTSIIEFETNIIIAGEGTSTGTLIFQVFKSSKCNPNVAPVAVSPVWTYTAPGVPTSDNIRFFICDSGDCADYTVVATVTAAVAVSAITLNNSNLKAITTCGPDICCCCH